MSRAPQSIRRALTRALAAVLLPLAATACSSQPSKQDAPLAGASIGGPFALVNKDGKTVHYSDFSGKYRIVYFGYTFCPDVCPLDMQHLMQGYHMFAKAHAALAKDVVPMFISIDPARDTPKVLGEWTANFGPELMGLTGSPQAIAKAADEWRAFYKKAPGTTPGSYLMNHSRMVYLMDRDGKPLALLPADKDGKAVEAEMEKWIH